MRVILPLLAALPALAAARNVVQYGLVGGWSEKTFPTSEMIDILNQTLSEGRYSDSLVNPGLCYSTVESVETQVVSGTNYRFTIYGCPDSNKLGQCPVSLCIPQMYAVTIYVPLPNDTPLPDDTPKVTSIIEKQPGHDGEMTFPYTKPAPNPTETNYEGLPELLEEEKTKMDNWIEAHGLNKFGDESSMAYLGGTPLFDESTGSTRDRYDYILSNNPDRPWLLPLPPPPSSPVVQSEVQSETEP